MHPGNRKRKKTMSQGHSVRFSCADTWIPLTRSRVVQDLETLSDQLRSSRGQDGVDSEAVERDGGGGGGGGESDPGGVGGSFGWEAFTLNYKVTC